MIHAINANENFEKIIIIECDLLLNRVCQYQADIRLSNNILKKGTRLRGFKFLFIWLSGASVFLTIILIRFAICGVTLLYINLRLNRWVLGPGFYGHHRWLGGTNFFVGSGGGMINLVEIYGSPVMDSNTKPILKEALKAVEQDWI